MAIAIAKSRIGNFFVIQSTSARGAARARPRFNAR